VGPTFLGSVLLEKLGYFCDASRLRLVMISDNSLDTVTVEALIDPVTVREELSHDHRLTASHASESSASSLVD